MNWFAKDKTHFPDPGIYHFDQSDNHSSNRVHLRVEKDKSSVLLVNASTMVHLNPSASFMAYLLLKKVGKAVAIEKICEIFTIAKSEAEKDLANFETQLNSLIYDDGLCPIHDLNLETLTPFSKKPSAPYRMDLALTYSCNNDCSHCYNVKSREVKEFSTDLWKKVLDQLWSIGIPHIVFTGGEPTLRNDLPELIAYAEKLGQITGLNTNGRKIHDQSYLDLLIAAGLDHLQITIESHDPKIHDEMVAHKGAWIETVSGIQNSVNSKVFLMTNTTLLKNNYQELDETLEFLNKLGVPTIGINALIHSGRGLQVDTGLKDEELFPLMKLAKEKTFAQQQKLIWYTPTRYCHFNPITEGLGVKGCTAALFNMCVEPDGNVIPCQSYYKPLGNILRDSWDTIWNHPLSLSLRERRNLPNECTACTLVNECGGGCPLASHVGEPEPRGIAELEMS